MSSRQVFRSRDIYQLDKDKALHIVFIALAMFNAPTPHDRLIWLCKKFPRPERVPSVRNNPETDEITFDDQEIYRLINMLLSKGEIQRKENGDLICRPYQKNLISNVSSENGRIYCQAMLDQLRIIANQIYAAQEPKKYVPARFNEIEWLNLFSAIEISRECKLFREGITFIRVLTGENARRKWRDGLLDANLDRDRILNCLQIGLRLTCELRDKESFLLFLNI